MDAADESARRKSFFDKSNRAQHMMTVKSLQLRIDVISSILVSPESEKACKVMYDMYINQDMPTSGLSVPMNLDEFMKHEIVCGTGPKSDKLRKKIYKLAYQLVTNNVHRSCPDVGDIDLCMP